VLLVILTGCVRQIELVEDPTVIVQLAEPVSAMVWIPDPETGKLFKAERIIPAGKLIVDRRWKKGDDDAR
jgi:hypothetical protein